MRWVGRVGGGRSPEGITDDIRLTARGETGWNVAKSQPNEWVDVVHGYGDRVKDTALFWDRPPV
jgi:hypothetical protein